MGLDQPLPVQLWRFISNVLQGNLGIDVWSTRSVAQIVLKHCLTRWRWSGIGHWLGRSYRDSTRAWSAEARRSWADRLIGVLSVSAIAIPSFIVAIYSPADLCRLAEMAAGNRRRGSR
jgi:peptide/nickel transport system permease protein